MAEVWRKNHEWRWHEANSKLQFDGFLNGDPSITSRYGGSTRCNGCIKHRRCGEWRRQTADGVRDIRGKSRMTVWKRVSHSMVIITAPEVGTRMDEDGRWRRKTFVRFNWETNNEH